MRSPDRHPTALGLQVYLVLSGITALVALVVAGRRGPRGGEPPATAAPVPLVLAASEPIRAEAQVFRTAPSMLAILPEAPRERVAHPRTLKTVRFLRAYPGAPPRIPHPLTAEEFRTDACRTCHERGGFSPRFAAYVPVTPHPDRGICLQCHVGVDSVMGRVDATADPNSRCGLCHEPNGGAPRASASVTWPSTIWPSLPPLEKDQAPPPIPHSLLFRENCLTCHAGPAAVAELRTEHPERANCRQCHVTLDPLAAPANRSARQVAARGGSP